MNEAQILIIEASAAAHEVDSAMSRLEAARTHVEAVKADLAASKALYDEKIAACEAYGLSKAAAKKAAEAMNEVFVSAGVLNVEIQQEVEVKAVAETRPSKRRRRKDEHEEGNVAQLTEPDTAAHAADGAETPTSGTDAVASEDTRYEGLPAEEDGDAAQASEGAEVHEEPTGESGESAADIDMAAIEVGVEEVRLLIDDHAQADGAPEAVKAVEWLHAALKASAEASFETGATGFTVGDFLKFLVSCPVSDGDLETASHASAWFRTLVDDLECGRSPSPISGPEPEIVDVDETAFAEPSYVGSVSDDVTFGDDAGYEDVDVREDIASMNFLADPEEDAAEPEDRIPPAPVVKVPPKFSPPAFLKKTD